MRKVKSAGTGKEPGLGQGTGHLGTSRAGRGQGATGFAGTAPESLRCCNSPTVAYNHQVTDPSLAAKEKLTHPLTAAQGTRTHLGNRFRCS